MRKSKIFWGIVLIFASVALILFAVVPSLTIGMSNLPIWKIILCVLIFTDMIRKIVESNKISEKFAVFIHLALIFVILKKNIAAWCSLPENFVNSWYIIVAAILLTIALGLISGSKTVRSIRSGDSHKNTMSETTIYIDASEGNSHDVSNKFGMMTVYFQNTDVVTDFDEFTLYISNKFGEIDIHIPENYTLEMKLDTAFGDVDARPNTITNGKKITIKGKNTFGEVRIVSP